MEKSKSSRLNLIYRIFGIIIAFIILYIIGSAIYGEEFYMERMKIDDRNIQVVNDKEIIVRDRLSTRGEVRQPILLLSEPKCGYKVTVDGETVYNKNDADCVYSYGTEYAPLPQDYVGREIEVHIYPKEKGKNVGISELYIISESDYSLMFTKRVFLRSSSAIVIFACGILFALCIAVYKMDEKNNNTLKWMGIFCICGGVWTFVSSGILIIVNVPFKTMYILEYLSLYIAVYSFMCYWGSEIEFTKREKKIADVMKLVIIAYILFALVIQLTGVATLYSILYIFHILCVVVGVYIIMVGIGNKIMREGIDRKTILKSVIILGVLIICVMEIVKSKVTSFYFKDSFLPYIMLGFAIVSIVRFINRALGGYLHEYQVDSLEQMAYIDVMTGIGNRNSCEKYFANIMEDNKSCYQLVMFDINGLKKVNDTIGHLEGDNLIKAFSALLKKQFESKGSFVGRMGGDEFVLIMNDSTTAVLRAIDSFNTAVENENALGINNFEIKYSYGIAACDRRKNEDVWKKFSEADRKMYSMKR